MPADYIESSKIGEKRQRLLTDEVKWKNNTFECTQCHQILKNGSKSCHEKHGKNS